MKTGATKQKVNLAGRYQNTFIYLYCKALNI